MKTHMKAQEFLTPPPKRVEFLKANAKALKKYKKMWKKVQRDVVVMKNTQG